MSTRFNVKPKSRFGIAHLPTGYDGKDTPTDFYIPPSGLVDVDRALFKLFDKEMQLQVTDSDNKDVQKKVPVLFAGGEKWAIIKKNKGIHDRNGTLILPLVTITRNDVRQDLSNDITGRGINQQTGELVIRRRIASTSDRSYQRLVNRLLVKNQQNVAVASTNADLSEQPGTERVVGDLSQDPTVAEGGMLVDNKLNNVYETIVIPSPQFFTATYTVTVWAQYLQHVNQILETIISSFLPQGNCWKLDTDVGYWYIATVDGNVFTARNNFDDMSTEERSLKKEFNVTVPGFLLASTAPGTPVPIRRYLSVPDVQFAIDMPTETTQSPSVDDPFLGADDPTLPITNSETWRADQRNDNATTLYPRNPSRAATTDPALRGRQPAQYKTVKAVDQAGNIVTRFIKIKSVNPKTGETIFYPNTDLGGLTIVSIED